MIEVLDEHAPGHGVDIEAMRAAMRGRYPWNSPEEPHLHLCEADAWWADMERRMAAALEEIGVAGSSGREIARAVRRRMTNPAVGWHLFEDTLPALEATAAAGYANAILSNHIPELASIVEGIGIGDAIAAVFSSAVTGYEKPHPQAFGAALAALGRPDTVWMVGDNPVADVAGAEALGIPAVLVRRPGAPPRPGSARREVRDLLEAAETILAA
jgi:putative hydrolase of the HAD superfamily